MDLRPLTSLANTSRVGTLIKQPLMTLCRNIRGLIDRALVRLEHTKSMCTLRTRQRLEDRECLSTFLPKTMQHREARQLDSLRIWRLRETNCQPKNNSVYPNMFTRIKRVAIPMVTESDRARQWSMILSINRVSFLNSISLQTI